MNQALLALSALAAVAGLSFALPHQDPVLEREVIVIAPRQPWQRTLVLESDLPARLIEVPAGRRFVLTDFWSFPHDEFRTVASDGDRVWLEQVQQGRRQVVFDVRAAEMPNPLRWETGPVLVPGDELWASYIFAGEKKSDALRRLFVSGYFEDLP